MSLFKKTVLIILVLADGILLLAGHAFMYFGYRRSLLDYNELGRYYDSAAGVVYHDSAVYAGFLIATVSYSAAIITTILVVLIVRAPQGYGKQT